MQNYILRIKDRRDNITYKEKRQEEIFLYNNVSKLRKDNKQINLT